MINKIIYFDKETIRNILQEKNSGEKIHTTDLHTSSQTKAALSAEGSVKVKLGMPFISRLTFLFTGKLDVNYIRKKDSVTTISTTEVSEFEELKDSLTKVCNVQLSDIENSSTFFRVAGGYVKMIKGDVGEIDLKEFKNVMDSYDGYDTYIVNNNMYVRFNNSAFVSNYKRNDLLTTTMTLYCIPVGKFKKERFDFLKEIGKMEQLISLTETSMSLADLYPPQSVVENNSDNDNTCEEQADKVSLYDVLYACISSEDRNDR